MNGDTYVPSPRPNPRLRPEGESFAERNRKGCGEKWYDYTPENNETPAATVTARMPSDEARKNAETNKGSIGDIFGGYRDTPPRRNIHPRAITAEGETTAKANRGDNMKTLLDDYGTGSPDPPPLARVKGDLAVEYAERNKGASENIINNYGVTPPSDDDVKAKMIHINRSNKEDSVTAILQMDPSTTDRCESRGYGKLHEQSQECWDELPPNRHSRPEGEQISRHMNNHMGDILSMKPNTPEKAETRKEPLHMQEAKTPRPNTGSRLRAEGQQNYDRDHSSASMNAVFGISTPEPTSVRAVKVNRMMCRSEEW